MRTIEAVDRPVLLDANLMLNASFIPTGQCDRALRLLAAHRKSIRIEEATWHECETRLAKLLGNGDALRHAIARLRNRMAAVPCMQVPPASVVAGLPRHDQHIMAYALQSDVIVLTTDNELRMRLMQAGRRALAPDGQEFWDNPYDGPPPSWLTAGDSSGVAELVVLLWAMPASFMRRRTNTIHTLFSAEGWGRLIYVNEPQRLMRFEAIRGDCLDVPIALDPSQAMAAAVTTRLDMVNFKESKSAIYACSGVGHRNSRPSQMKTVPLLPSNGQRWLGSTGGARDHWGGHLRSVDIAGNWLSKKMWAVISSHKDFRPSFCIDNGKLPSAVASWWSSVQSSRMTG